MKEQVKLPKAFYGTKIILIQNEENTLQGKKNIHQLENA